MRQNAAELGDAARQGIRRRNAAQVAVQCVVDRCSAGALQRSEIEFVEECRLVRTEGADLRHDAYFQFAIDPGFDCGRNRRALTGRDAGVLQLIEIRLRVPADCADD